MRGPVLVHHSAGARTHRTPHTPASLIRSASSAPGSRPTHAALLVSELATNALLHGAVQCRLFRVHLTLTATTLRIEVSDARGERLPGLREAGDDECYGRGLVIVARLADHWGVEPRTVGKTVFAELALRQRPDMPMGPRELRAGPSRTPTPR
ncbi:ATP-binding protein [Streptomyces atratus]|uniref:ATP-binding protein n=1 Tax=Streptomyces atratus TaxID=1893 RepID=UPI00379B716C